MNIARALAATALLFALACGSGTTTSAWDDALSKCAAGQTVCSGACVSLLTNDQDCGACGNKCGLGTHCAAGACAASNIKHVVLILQENHTYDSYFGLWGSAKAGSNPTCTAGRACAEAAPAQDATGHRPYLLDDAMNTSRDPSHSQACELRQLDSGKMDRFTTGAGIGSSLCEAGCSSPYNFALADADTVGMYWTLADRGALADRYFQSVAGSSSSNDMYFAQAHLKFVDNDAIPAAAAAGCMDPLGFCTSTNQVTYSGEVTIADLLSAAQRSLAVYADGYAEAVAAGDSCPGIPDECPYSDLHPVLQRSCLYDPSDVPFQYYAQLADNPRVMRDYGAFASDIAKGKLPEVSFIKARTFRNEHPGYSTISDGAAFVAETIDAVYASPYKNDTLILVTWDEGGGFYDHVAPPPSVDTDDAGHPVQHGTRVPLLALGRFARQGTVSHTVMDHSSIVRFLEYNFIGPTGLLGHADGKVNNLGSLLDPTQTGIAIP